MSKLRLDEDLFDDVIDIDIPDVEADITIDPELSGPETPEDMGQATILLDAISCIAKNIDQYNVLRANLTDPEMIAVVDEMASNENTNLGKLQALLKKVSPNAENIMNGAVEAEQELSESLKESKLNESSDGWSERIEDELHYIFDRFDELAYEVRNCVRGVYTNCDTSDELADYVSDLGEEVIETAEALRRHPNYDEENESLKEDLDDDNDFEYFKKNYPDYNKKFDNKQFGRFFDKEGNLKPETKKEFYRVSGIPEVWADEPLDEDKIADRIKANQDTKKMTKQAIGTLKRIGGQYKDLAKEFEDTYDEPIDEAENKWEDAEWRKYHGVDDDSFYDDNIETFGSPYSEEEPDEEEVHLVLSKDDRFVGDVDDDFEARYDVNSIKELEESAERNMVAQREQEVMGAWQESLNPMANMKASSAFVPPVVQPMYPTTPQAVNENQNITEDIMNVDFADIDDDF